MTYSIGRYFNGNESIIGTEVNTRKKNKVIDNRYMLSDLSETIKNVHKVFFYVHIHLNVICRYKSHICIMFTFIPIFVHLTTDINNVTFPETQFSENED